jgi:hypothetical protein
MTKDKATESTANVADELRKATKCLFLEVPEQIAKDIQMKAETVINERDQLLGEVARLKRILNPIVACYGLGLSPEKFVGQVGPWIEEARVALSSGKE